MSALAVTPHDNLPAILGRGASADSLRQETRLRVTRSSDNWLARTGSLDVTHYSQVYPSDNVWGIPIVRASRWIPERLCAWHQRRNARHLPDPGSCALHYFLDDYHFEAAWRRPSETLHSAGCVGGLLTPDFSLYTDMARAVQLYNVYRNRWMGAYWQAQGLTVVPTITLLDRDTYDFGLAGLEPEGTYAISATGDAQPNIRRFLHNAVAAIVQRLRPYALLVYGGHPDRFPPVPPEVKVHRYPTFWETRKPQISAP